MQLLKKKTAEIPKKQKPLKEKIKLFTIKVKGLPYTCKKKDIKNFFNPITPFSIRIPRNIKGIAYVGYKSERKFVKALTKDKSILCGRKISVTKFDSDKKKEVLNDHKKYKWKTQEESLKNEEDTSESGRIFMRNLAYTTTEEDVQKLFEKYGPLVEVNLPIDFVTRKPKGFGIVTFLMPEHAVKAYMELDGSILNGRMLHLLPGKAKDDPTNDNEGKKNLALLNFNCKFCKEKTKINI